MNKMLTLVGMAIFIAACSADSSELGLPSVSIPTNLNNTATDNEDASFLVHIGRVALILSTDFTPG